MAHRWAVHGKAFWLQALPMDGPCVDYAWESMGSQYESGFCTIKYELIEGFHRKKMC